MKNTLLFYLIYIVVHSAGSEWLFNFNSGLNDSQMLHLVFTFLSSHGAGSDIHSFNCRSPATAVFGSLRHFSLGGPTHVKDAVHSASTTPKPFSEK